MTLENIIQVAEHMTPVESAVGTYVLENLEQIPQMSITELASQTNVSKSAIHRFCKKLGFSGFNQLRVAAARDLAETRSNLELIDVNYPFSANDGPQMIAKKLEQLYESAIQETYHYLDFIEIQRVARMLNNATSVDIYTHAHNMNAAENFQDKMLTIGKTVNCPKGFYNQRATVLASTPDRVAVILSYSGRASFIRPVIQTLFRKNIPVVLIGKAGSNLYPQYITHALCISSKENLQDRISQFSSHIAMQYILDVIFGCIYNLNRDQNIAYLKNSMDFIDDRELEE